MTNDGKQKQTFVNCNQAINCMPRQAKPFPFFEYFYPRLLQEFNLDAKHSNDQYMNWLEKMGNSYQSQKDFIWSLMQKISLHIAGENTKPSVKYRKLKNVAMQMLLFLIKEKKKTFNARKLIAQYDLLMQTDCEFEMLVSIITTKDCIQSQQFKDVELTLDEAIQKELIPHKQCERYSECVCGYGFQAKRDTNGRIVMKKS